MIEINFGILAAQIVTFLIGMGLLWKIAWGPLTQVLRERSSTIQKELQLAREKRSEAEQLEANYRQQLTAIEAKAQEVMNRTTAQAQILKEQMLKSAHEESKKLMEKTKEALEADRLRLLAELRQELSRLVVSGAESLLRHSIDPQTQKQWSQDFLTELEHYARKQQT